MSNKANQVMEDDEIFDQQSDFENEIESEDSLVHQNQQQKQVQTQPQSQPRPQPQQPQQQMQQQQYQDYSQLAPRAEGYRRSAIRESRIKDRPPASPASNSAVKIKIELDLEVEVDLYARVKGDVTIGLM